MRENFFYVRQRERVFQNQAKIEKVKKERARERQREIVEEMIRNELEKEKEGRQRKGVGYVCGGEKKKKRMDDIWCEGKNNIKNKK